MSNREKRLAVVFGGILAVFVIGWGIRSMGGEGKDSKSLTHRVSEMKTLLKTRDLWETRDEWIGENMPAYQSDVLASSSMVQRVERLLKAHRLTVSSLEFAKEESEYDAVEEESYFNRTELLVEVQGDMKNIVQCIHEIQSPKFFTGVDQLTIQSSETGDMKCQLGLTHWYTVY